jgi:hypothetical protein
MRTCFARCRVFGSGHPLNGELGGYCRGNLPRVPWAIGYGPKILNAFGSLQQLTLGNHTHHIRKMTLPLIGWRDGSTNLKRTNHGDEPRRHLSTLRSSAGGQYFTTCPPYPATREGDPSLRMPGGCLIWISLTCHGSPIASTLITGHDGT